MEFVVYVLVCICGLRYVGSTIFPVKKRILEHLRAIRNGDLTYTVAKHCASVHGDIFYIGSKISYFGIDSIPEVVTVSAVYGAWNPSISFAYRARFLEVLTMRKIFTFT